MSAPKDDAPAKPVEPTQTERLYEQAVSFQAADARRQRRYNLLRNSVLSGSAVLNVALTTAICMMLPLKTVVPVYGFMNEAGLFDTTTEISDLPPSVQVAGIEALLWNYLRDREGFAPSEADQNYDTVSKLSSDVVKAQYQGDANVKFNPQAPAKLLGPNGFIRINRLSANWVRHADDYTNGTYQVHFCRTIVRQETAPVQQRLQANITFEMLSKVPLEQRITFNPAGLVITEYPGAREEGAQGVAHPCA
nr:VirB8/TrbF family protein [uncultured Rhodopila sp.]